MDAQIKIMADISRTADVTDGARLSRVGSREAERMRARINRETESAIRLYLSLSRVFPAAVPFVNFGEKSFREN